MSTQIDTAKGSDQKMKVNFQGGSGDTVYAMGIFGAWAFYFGRAKNFQEGLLGFFKGLFWPAFLVYELLSFLHKE